ncbi:MAG: hypothetical protein ACOC4J_00805, partial [Bacteroidota bacterium]
DLNSLTVKKLIAERQRDKFSSIEDFILRVEKTLLSDFILKRLLESHLFESLPDKMTLDDMIRIRDKNSKTLEKIGAKLFGEATNTEAGEKKSPSTEKLNHDNITFLQEEMNSYGFVINMERVFGVSFDPFYLSDLNIGIITNELKVNRFEVNNGIEYRVFHPSSKLKPGEAVLFLKHRNESFFKGLLDQKQKEIVLDQKDLFDCERIFYKNKSSMKKAGIKKIKIRAKKYNLEVLL